MKPNQTIKEMEKQKMVHHLQKATEILLNLFSFMNITPSMIEITNIIDYAKNLELMLQELCKTLPKKCIPLQVFKKIESESLQKTQKIHKLLQSEKNLKIEVKVLEEKNQQLQLKQKEKESQSMRENKVSDSLEKYMKSQKEREKQKQAKNIQISERYIIQKLSSGSPRKRLSLPYLSSNSIHIPPTQKSILKHGRPSGSKPKKQPFVTIPGEGSEILIHHLMNKAINK